MYTGIFAVQPNEGAEKRFALTDRARSNKKQSCTAVCNQAMMMMMLIITTHIVVVCLEMTIFARWNHKTILAKRQMRGKLAHTEGVTVLRSELQRREL